MSVAHRADKRTLAQREVRQGSGANLEALARIADLLRQAARHAAGGAAQGAGGSARELPAIDGESRLRRGRADQGRHPRRAARFRRRRHPSVCRARPGADYFAAAGAPSEFQLLLDEARGEFEKTDIARDVRAGFAAAEVAAKAAATLETDPATVRDTYRAMLRETMNMGQLFDALEQVRRDEELHRDGGDLHGSGRTRSCRYHLVHRSRLPAQPAHRIVQAEEAAERDGRHHAAGAHHRAPAAEGRARPDRCARDREPAVELRGAVGGRPRRCAGAARQAADRRTRQPARLRHRPARPARRDTGRRACPRCRPASSRTPPCARCSTASSATRRQAFDKQQSGGKPKRDTGGN